MTDRRILVLSFYFEPDLSAGSFRTTALVDALLREDPTLAIDVVTTAPNRYGTFASTAPAEETRGRARIRRIALPTHRSGMRDQSRAFGHFMWAAMRMVRGERYDLVYATSSRLMTAALGALIAKRVRAPLYLDIRDIFVDTMADVLPGRVAPLMTPALGLIERHTIAAAAHVNLVSRGFEEYFAGRYPRQSFSYFTNGIDEEFLVPAPTRHGRDPDTAISVVYAGNIGEGQGLHAVLPGLARRFAGRAQFVVIGDGGRRALLERGLAEAGVTNVLLRPPVSRPALLEEYRKADVLFLHLNDYDAFRKVLPSKIFEYAALGKPIWAGVAGYAARFLAEEVPNVAVFPPCDVDRAATSFERLELRDVPRTSFIEKYRREHIMRSMAAHVLAIASPAFELAGASP